MEVANTFTQVVCNDLANRMAKNMHTLTLVVPARRSERFFSNAFANYYKSTGKAGILPRILTLSELIEQSSKRRKLSTVEAAFYFYEIYLQKASDCEDFEKFLKWGLTLINDFNEIDNYLIDAKIFYSDLRNIREIEEWSFNSETLSENQLRFNLHWKKYYDYYLMFNEYLSVKHVGYSGAINRELALDPDSIIEKNKHVYYVFAGFNALTKCEQKIIRHLISEKKAEIIFDGDNYYFENPAHEAGIFLRRQKEYFDSNFKLINADQLKSGAKKIHFYKCNGEVQQCDELVSLIQKNELNINSNGVIVLCNEKLLPALITKLPANANSINVTMGWALSYLAIFDFITSYIDYQIRYSTNKKYVSRAVASNLISSAFRVFQNLEIDSDKTWITRPEMISAFFSKYNLGFLFPDVIQASNLNFAIVKLLDDLLLNQSSIIFEKEAYLHLIENFRKMEKIPGFFDRVNTLTLYKNIVSKFITSNPLSFIGEPMKGVQVMGMLETRGVDFEEVYLLSANERILPAQNSPQSFIPYDLRKHYKLPGKAEQDAVFAYYFYRLIQRANKIHLFYNSQNESFGQAEKSRYLLQIEKELLLDNTNIFFKEHVSSNPLLNLTEDISVVKSEFYFKRIKELFLNGISATMISDFVNCELAFYYKYVLLMSEQDLHDTFSEADIGTLVHGVFQCFFDSIIEKKIDAIHVEKWLGNLANTTEEIAQKIFHYRNFNSGTDWLGMKFAEELIRQFLLRVKTEKSNYDIIGKTVIGVEKKLEIYLAIAGEKVKLKGTIDLLLCDDQQNYFIYDFKTGAVNSTFFSESIIEEIQFDFEKAISKKISIQLLVYLCLVRENYKANELSAHAISLSKGGSGLFPVNDNKNESKNAITEVLNRLVNDLLNEKLTLSHNEESKYCEFCQRKNSGKT